MFNFSSSCNGVNIIGTFKDMNELNEMMKMTPLNQNSQYIVMEVSKQKETVASVMNKLKINPEMSGSAYIHDAVTKGLSNPEFYDYITKYTYPHLANKYKTTNAAIERAMRVAIEDCWKNPDNTYKQYVFGELAEKSRPSNACFIKALVNYLR